MNQADKNPWQKLYRGVIQNDRLGGEHFVDDDEFLDRWSLGEIDASERDMVQTHLVGCAYCREVLCEMFESGLVDLPPPVQAATEAVAEHIENSEHSNEPPAVQRAEPPIGRKKSQIGVITVAALIMLAVGIGYGNRQVQTSVAIVEADLKDQRPAAALKGIDALQGSWFWLAPGSKLRSRELAEQAGYEVAKEKLGAGQFSEAAEIARRIETYEANSARLENVRVQASRRQRYERTLREKRDLTAYEYRLNGTSMKKGIEEEKELPAEAILRAALERYPDDVTLQINLGQLLLEAGKTAEAINVFSQAVRLASKDLDARIGLGIGYVKARQRENALREFQVATELDPECFSAHLNAAVVLEMLNRGPEAEVYWTRALELAPDDQWRMKINNR